MTVEPMISTWTLGLEIAQLHSLTHISRTQPARLSVAPCPLPIFHKRLLAIRESQPASCNTVIRGQLSIWPRASACTATTSASNASSQGVAAGRTFDGFPERERGIHLNTLISTLIHPARQKSSATPACCPSHPRSDPPHCTITCVTSAVY